MARRVLSAAPASAGATPGGQCGTGERCPGATNRAARAVAATCLADAEARRRGTRELITWLEHHEALPVAGFEEPTGLAVLFEFLELANAGDWAACRSGLPLLLRACRKHDSIYWLLGRRARDAKTPAGRSFLDEVVVPGLLASPRLDDAERVATLRRLYDVEYTGPRPFVDIAGPGLDGREIRTADLRGRVLLVDYWATWCTPCLMALPGVAAVHRRFRDRGLAVVGVSIDDARDREKVAAKVKELGLEFPVIFDGRGGKGELALANKVLAVPATFLIDRKGRVRFSNLEGDALAARIAELLDER